MNDYLNNSYDDGSTSSAFGQSDVQADSFGFGDVFSSPTAGTTPPGAETQPYGVELSIQAPYLDEVSAGHITLGGTRSGLSELVLDVEVPVEVYFGNAALTVEEFLEMGSGSVVELDHNIDAPIELRVRGKLVAYGQLVAINGNYGLRITDMVEQQ